MNFLSPDGRCFSFDHRANGYARGEVNRGLGEQVEFPMESGRYVDGLLVAVVT